MEYHLRIGENIMQVPWWWLDALLVWLALMGLVMWLLGRRLARPSFAGLGLLAGAATMLLFNQTLIAERWPGTSPAPFLFAGGLVGAIGAFVLWRLGIGLLLAVTVAFAAPTTFIVAYGLQGPDVNTPATQAWSDFQAALEQSSKPDAKPRDLPQAMEPLAIGQQGIIEACQTWWTGLTLGMKWMIVILAVGGASLALFIGFALPLPSASLVTALFGTLLVLALAYRLAHHIGPNAQGMMPSSPKTFLYVLGAMTLLGALVQTWLFGRKKAAE